MILKITDYAQKGIRKEGNPKKFEKVYWLYDGLHRIKYKGEKILGENRNDYKLLVLDPRQDQQETTVHEVGAVDRNNNEYIFAFDTECFILNDEGQTIEIIR